MSVYFEAKIIFLSIFFSDAFLINRYAAIFYSNLLSRCYFQCSQTLHWSAFSRFTGALLQGFPYIMCHFSLLHWLCVCFERPPLLKWEANICLSLMLKMGRESKDRQQLRALRKPAVQQIEILLTSAEKLLWIIANNVWEVQHWDLKSQQDLTASITSILKAWICCPHTFDSCFFAQIRNNGPVSILKAMFYLVPYIKIN